MLSNVSLVALIISVMVLFTIGATFCILYFMGFRYKSSKGPTLETVSKHNYRTVFGHKIHYTQEGQGEDLLLIHGIGASHYVWRFIVPLLTAHYKVTAVDLLGFGLSDKPNTFKYDLDSQCDVILELLKEIGIQRCVVIGSSMGGTISLRLSQLRGDVVEKVIAISPAADPKVVLFDLNRLAFLSPVVMPLVTERFVKQIMRLVYSDKKHITLDNIKIYAEPYSNNPAAIDSFVKSFSLLKDPRVFEDLEKIKDPVLLLWGKKDRIVSAKLGAKIQNRIPNATLEVHESAGHHVQEEYPDWVFAKIIQFLKT